MSLVARPLTRRVPRLAGSDGHAWPRVPWAWFCWWGGGCGRVA